MTEAEFLKALREEDLIEPVVSREWGELMALCPRCRQVMRVRGRRCFGGCTELEVTAALQGSPS